MFYRILVITFLTFPFFAGEASGTQNSESAPAVGSKGMVSSAHPIATEAGLSILSDGGNAFDAAVAVASTLNVCEPQNSGMGGYGIILIYDASKKQIRVLNSSGRLPLNVDSDVFREPNPDFEENRKSAKAISTPTNLNAWESLSKTYGKLEWGELFAPAIQAAMEGHAVNASVAATIKSSFDKFSDEAKSIYGKNGKPLAEGDFLVQQNLADSLILVATDGAKALYGGPIGDDIIATVQEAGSFLSMEDLKRNEAEWWDPIHINYRGYDVYTASPPGNSFSSLIRLGMMERFDVEELGHNTVPFLHHFAEVTKHAYWCRLKYAGDPDVAPPPLNRLLSDRYLKRQTKKLDLEHASTFVPPGVSGSPDGHTTHFVVADSEGNIVCATQTIGSGFGSKVMVKGRGIWLNNSLFFCTFEPKGNPMDAHPGRRKLNSNHPTIIMKNGLPWAAIGTPGGHTIGQSLPQMTMNLIDFGMNVQEAITAPRVTFKEPNELSIEKTFQKEIQDALTEMGHEVGTTRAIGNAHGLTIDYSSAGVPVRFTGGADPRGRGMASGYSP
jgi:gamma-glutamyltranspeptidase/glutathione hydrolase